MTHSLVYTGLGFNHQIVFWNGYWDEADRTILFSTKTYLCSLYFKQIMNERVFEIETKAMNLTMTYIVNPNLELILFGNPTVWRCLPGAAVGLQARIPGCNDFTIVSKGKCGERLDYIYGQYRLPVLLWCLQDENSFVLWNRRSFCRVQPN